MRSITKVLVGATLLTVVFAGGLSPAYAAIAIEQITDVNGTPGGPAFGGAVNVFASGSGAPFQVDDTANSNGNDIAVYTMNGQSAGDGAGLSISLSNGDNGLDPPNPEPADPVFAAIGNASGRLENGNALRFSMWMRQDPADPVTVVPQIEPVVKLELWKTALSGNADFSNVAFPGSGERIWDTDQNAGNSLFEGHNQSQASWVDMNNSGTTSFGKPVAASLVTDEWRLVEAYLVVDDDPLDDGLGWSIGTEFFNVTHVEEIRAVMFLGDFAGTNLTNAGSIWVDNLLLEAFGTEAEMLATPNPNTAPTEGVPGDYNGNGVADAPDYVLWRDDPTAFGGDPDGYNTWRAHFGNPLGAGGAIGAGVVPEPASWMLALLAAISLTSIKRRTVKA